MSHKYKFLHIKNGKVAVTSFELSLSNFLGENDIITPLGTPDEIDRYSRGFKTAQHFLKPLFGMKPKKWPRAVRSRILSKLTTGQR